jgi:hypothetical protein
MGFDTMGFTGFASYMDTIEVEGHCSLAASPQLHKYGSHQEEGEMVASQVMQESLGVVTEFTHYFLSSPCSEDKCLLY